MHSAALGIGRHNAVDTDHAKLGLKIAWKLPCYLLILNILHSACFIPAVKNSLELFIAASILIVSWTLLPWFVAARWKARHPAEAVEHARVDRGAWGSMDREGWIGRRAAGRWCGPVTSSPSAYLIHRVLLEQDAEANGGRVQGIQPFPLCSTPHSLYLTPKPLFLGSAGGHVKGFKVLLNVSIQLHCIMTVSIVLAVTKVVFHATSRSSEDWTVSLLFLQNVAFGLFASNFLFYGLCGTMTPDDSAAEQHQLRVDRLKLENSAAYQIRQAGIQKSEVI